MKIIYILIFLVLAYFGSAYAMREQNIALSASVCERQISKVQCNCIVKAIRDEYPLYIFWVKTAYNYIGGTQAIGRRLSIAATQCAG